MDQKRYDAYTDLLHKRLSEHRIRHSIGVMQEAAELARIHGENPEKAEIAGLLHDMTKEFTREEHFRMFEKYSFPLDPNLRTNKNLWHAASASLDIRETLGIDDPQIASAIRYHTTGRADMTGLETVLYVADLTEPNRDYPDAEFYRKLAREDLKKTAYLATVWCVADLEKRGLPVHQDMLNARAELAGRYPGITEEGEKRRIRQL